MAAIVILGAVASKSNNKALDSLSRALDLKTESQERQVDRLIEKMLSSSPDAVTAQHSAERQNKDRLDAYVEAKHAVMQTPPTNTQVPAQTPPDRYVSEDETKKDGVMPYDLDS